MATRDPGHGAAAGVKERLVELMPARIYPGPSFEQAAFEATAPNRSERFESLHFTGDPWESPLYRYSAADIFIRGLSIEWLLIEILDR